LSSPRDVALDSSANLYIADTENNTIRKVTPGGLISTVAGSGIAGFCGDSGPAISACLNGPRGVAIDSSGNLYIADSDNNRIRKVTPGGVISTLAGNGSADFSGDDGSAAASSLNFPYNVSLDSAGNLYIADTNNSRIRKVTISGETATITTVAGDGNTGYASDGGPATETSLNYPRYVAAGKDGNIYIADSDNNLIRKVDSDGLISTVAGDGNAVYSEDGGAATATSLNYPTGVAADSSGNIYISDTNNYRIRKVDKATGNISTFAGNGTSGFNGDEMAATAASLISPRGVLVSSAGTVFFVDENSHRLRVVTADGMIHTLAGGGGAGYSGDGGAAVDANLSFPHAISRDNNGNVYIADTYNHRIRKVTTGNIISTLAGNGVAGFGGDRFAATAAQLSSPSGVAVDSSGNVFIADTGNNRIRKVTPGGIITTVAGTGIAGYNGDGADTTTATLNSPRGMTFDNSGNLFVADSGNHRIRKITPGGVISTAAGDGIAGYNGDGSDGPLASLNAPRGVAIDNNGSLFIADTENNRIRKVSAAGIISTVAGNGTYGYTGFALGPATGAFLAYPSGIAIDDAGNIYIADTDVNQIRKVFPNGRLKTVSGLGNPGFSGDGGPASMAALSSPSGLALDSAGNLLLADSFNSRIRRIENVSSPLPTGNISINGSQTTISRSIYPTFACSDRYGNSCQSMRISVDGALDNEGWIPFVSYTELTLPYGAGSKTVSVQFMDSEGLVSSTYTVSILFNQPPPIGSLTINAGATLTWSSEVALALSCKDILDIACQGMRISVDGTLDNKSWLPFAAATQITLPAGNGQKQVLVQFKSVDGFISSTYATAIDVYVVTVSLTSTPPQVSTRNVAFGFSASEPVSFECRFDMEEGTFKPCSNPLSKIMPGGSHIFEVRATNQMGAVSAAARYDWVVMDILAGTAHAWGGNAFGQLGLGTSDLLAHPLIEKMPSPAGFIQIAAKGNTVFGVRNDGTVWMWGHTAGKFYQSPKQIQTTTGGFEDIVAVSVNSNGFVIALKADGTVWTMYAIPDTNGELIYMPVVIPDFSLKSSGSYGPTAISTEGSVFAALKSNGTVWTWEYNVPPVKVATLTNVTAISTCNGWSMALDANGVIWSWGSGTLLGRTVTPETPANIPGRVTTGSGMGAVSAIACGSDFAMAVSNGIVWTWGANSVGQLGIGTIPNANGSSVPVSTGIQINGLIAAGDQHALAVSRSNTLYAWGKNNRGQLGIGLYDSSSHPIPMEVGYLSGISAISAGYDFSVALNNMWAISDVTTVAECNKNTNIPKTLKVDPQNRVHIIWEGGCDARETYHDTNESGVWTREVIPKSEFDLSPYPLPVTDLAFSSDGTLHFVYSRWLPANGGTNVVHAYRPVGGSWVYETVDSGNNSDPILTIDSANNLHVVYTKQNMTDYGLFYVRKIGASWSVPEKIASSGAVYKESIAVGSDGTIHITYLNGSLYYVKKTGAGWSTPLMLATGLGYHITPIKTSGANGSVVSIVYVDTLVTPDNFRHYRLKFITNRSQSTSSPDETGGWTDMIVDDYEISTGLSPSLAVKDGKINIAYYDRSNGNLKFATAPDQNGPTSFLLTTVDFEEDVGDYASLDVDTFGISHIAYRSLDDTGNNPKIKYATNGDIFRPTGDLTISGAGMSGYTTSRDVVLHPSCNDGYGSGCWQMKFSYDNVNWTQFEAYAAEKSWTLPAGEGQRTIYVKYRDAANNWSGVSSANVFLDTAKPTGGLNIKSVNGFTNNRLVLLTTICDEISSGITSGCDKMKFSTDGITYSNPAFSYSNESPIYLPDGDGLKDVYVIYTDKAGNESTPVIASVKLDATAPVTTADPPGGDRVRSFNVALTCNDNGGSGCASTCYSVDGGVETLYTTPIYVSGISTQVILNYYSIDKLGNKESTRTEKYIFEPGVTTLTLDTPPTALQNKPLEVSGKLTRLPDTAAHPNNDMDLSGLPITLTISGPPGSQCGTTPCTISQTVDAQGQLRPILTYSSLGHYEVKGFNKFDYPGVYTIKAHFGGTGLHQAVDSTPENLTVGVSAGYAIIVEGKVSSNEGLASHNKTANRIYTTLIEKGFDASNIKYFNYGGSLPIKGVSANDVNSIRWSIETWAKEHMNGAPAPLYVIFVDHGNSNTFFIYPETINPDELNSWLGNLESQLVPAAKLQKRIIILGACYSGSFLDNLKQAPTTTDAEGDPNTGRIVISSAAADEQSYKGPNEPDGIRSGEFFMEELFKSLKRGSSLKVAFVDAAAQTRSFTSQGGGSVNSANGYNDNAVQHPLLDDNGDGVGSNNLGDGIGDGIEADKVHLGVGVTNSSLGLADIKNITPTQFLSAALEQRLLELEAYGNSEVSSAWFEVKAPTTRLTGDSNTFQLDLDLPRWAMTLNTANGKWQGTYGSDITRPADKFGTSGKYEVFYFTRSTSDEISEMRRSVVYKDKDTNSTYPATFDLIAPADSGDTDHPTEVKTTFNMVWSTSSDPDGLTYTVQIATDYTFSGTSTVFQKEEIKNSWYYVDASAGLSDNTDYYWRVIAVDSYGKSTISTHAWPFKTNNTNFPSACLISGAVSGIIPGKATEFSVMVLANDATVAQTSTFSGGNYFFNLTPGSYKLRAAATGYTVPDVMLSFSTCPSTQTGLPATINTISLQTAAQGGVGTVNCTKNSGASCSGSFYYGDSILLTASPSWRSLFGSWSSGYCNAVTSPTCSFTLKLDTTETANFNPINRTRVAAKEFSSLQDAYDDPETLTGAVIKARVHAFEEPNLIFDQEKVITIEGGFDDSEYSLTSGGYTTVKGSITVKKGTLKVKGTLAIK
jgi:alpha-tubulin suppressor-like RCC1 family protein/sugar lactone lactonase YvrE